MKEYMDYTEAQRLIIDRYLEATKDNPSERMPLEKLVGVKGRFPKGKPDKYMVAKCEKDMLTDGVTVKRGRKKREISNSYVVEWFVGYAEYKLATEDFYWLDDILTGICTVALEGATRQLSKYLVFDFLSTADTINTDLISKVCDVQERQAQKIMAALVVAQKAVEKEFKRMDSANLQHERRYLYLT